MAAGALCGRWATNNLWPVTKGMSTGVRSFRDSCILVLSNGFTIGAPIHFLQAVLRTMCTTTEMILSPRPNLLLRVGLAQCGLCMPAWRFLGRKLEYLDCGI